MTALARDPAKCGGRGSSERTGEFAADVRCANEANAIDPKPQKDSCRKSRREAGERRSELVDIDERVQIEQSQGEFRQRVLGKKLLR